MTLVVEDGAARADAESYASVAAATAYHDGRGNLAWGPLSEIAKERALRRATDYMGEVYALLWSGRRVTLTQALDWPRWGAPMREAPVGAYFPPTTVPAQVSRACMELALRSISGPLTPDLGQAVKSEKLGPIETVYQDYSAETRTYRAIDNLLAPLLASAGGIRVMRA